MFWLLGFALIVIFWFVFPPFRKFILIVGGLFVLLTLGFILYNNFQESASKSLIPRSQIQLKNLRLGTDNIGEKELYGEVQNNSDKELLDIYLKITAYDCPESSITPSCTTIGQDDDGLEVRPVRGMREATAGIPGRDRPREHDVIAHPERGDPLPIGLAGKGDHGVARGDRSLGGKVRTDLHHRASRSSTGFTPCAYV